jgi:hypothetical protein
MVLHVCKPSPDTATAAHVDIELSNVATAPPILRSGRVSVASLDATELGARMADLEAAVQRLAHNEVLEARLSALEKQNAELRLALQQQAAGGSAKEDQDGDHTAGTLEVENLHNIYSWSIERFTHPRGPTDIPGALLRLTLCSAIEVLFTFGFFNNSLLLNIQALFPDGWTRSTRASCIPARSGRTPSPF